MPDIKTRFTLEGEQNFRSAMNNAANAIKVLNSEQKLAKAQFQATGDAEKYAAQAAETLKKKIEQQKQAVAAAESALKQLSANGVAENSKQFQQWQIKLNNAQTALAGMERDLKDVTGTMATTGEQAEQTGSAIAAIGKKVSIDQVLSGINGITGALEGAARKAKELATAIWDELMDSAKWADDSATMALMYGIDLDRYLRMQKLVKDGNDTTVEAILKSQDKLKKGVGNGTTAVMDSLRELGLVKTIIGGVLGGGEEIIAQDSIDLFWKAGQAIMALGDEYEKEAKAQALFGRSWKDLIPLFTQYKSAEEYEEALNNLTVESEDGVNKLVALNDKIGELEGNFDTLKHKVLSGLAPALTGAAEVLSGLLERLTQYLQTEEGKKALADMEKAVSGLFEDLGKIDPEQVVEGFTGVFNAVIEKLQWLSENWESVVNGLKWIIEGWAALKLTGGALEILQFINGLNQLKNTGTISSVVNRLFGGGGGGTGTGTGTGGGGGWLTGIVSKVLGGSLGAGSGGLVLPGLIGAVVAGWNTGWKLLNDNLNDENLNEVYGDNSGEGGILDNLTDDQMKAMRDYFKVFTDETKTGTEEAFDARDALLKSFEDSGIEMSEQAVSLIENLFDNILKGVDPDGLIAKLLAEHPDIFSEPKEPDTDASRMMRQRQTGEQVQEPDTDASWMMRKRQVGEKVEQQGQDFGETISAAWESLGILFDSAREQVQSEIDSAVKSAGEELKKLFSGPKNKALEEEREKSKQITEELTGENPLEEIWALFDEELQSTTSDAKALMEKLAEKYVNSDFYDGANEIDEALNALAEVLDEETWAALVDDWTNYISGKMNGAKDLDVLSEEEAFALIEKVREQLAAALTEEPPAAEVEAHLSSDAEKKLQEEAAKLKIVVVVSPTLGESDLSVDGLMAYRRRVGHANGLWSVPYDGYPAILHKGERVVTAREVQNESRNYHSNLYVESMYMNNGMDAEALAAAMSAANRRTMRGYGS